MSINGVSANYYPTAYMNTNTPKSTETASFADTIVEKAAIGKIDYDERAFNFFAPNAPDEVREAWLEAAKETGALRFGTPLRANQSAKLGSTEADSKGERVL